MENVNTTVKILIYLKTRSEPFIGSNKPQPNFSRLVNHAVSKYLDELEASQK